MMAELSVLRSNVGGYIAQWQLAQPCSITLRADDAVRPFAKVAGDRAVLDIVIFSDFECPACARFARFFDKNVPPLFDQRLRVVFRHYPLDQSCNSGSLKTVHPHACEAAFLAEGARELGGTEAFWKAHDFLFEHQSETAAGRMTAERLAGAIGLDAAALKSSADKAAVMPRIVQDLEQVRACSLRATPGIYIDGRRIESAASSNIEFWDKMADWFWRERAKEARPQSTRTLAANPSTPQGSSITP
jgi:protein-disulfide isomerase